MHYMSRHASNDQNDWATFILGSGNLTDIDIDNDGDMPSTAVVVDITQALSQRLGRQMSMHSTYKIDYLSIRLVNSTNGLDNDSAAQFGGRIHWWSPTKHRIDAMHLARATETAVESSDIDLDSYLLATQQDYKGMRYNWNYDDQVSKATAEGFTALSGNEWDLEELFELYGEMLDVPTQTNALWSSNRTGYPDQMAWGAGYSNRSDANIYTAAIPPDVSVSQQMQPRDMPFVIQDAGIEAMCGLLYIDVESCNTDDVASSFDDDYHLLITVGVSGWSDF